MRDYATVARDDTRYGSLPYTVTVECSYAHTTDTEKATAIASLSDLMPLDEAAHAIGTDDETGEV